MSADKITVSGIRCRCRVGVPATERRKPQTVLIDLEAEADLERAGKADDMRLAPDYEGLAKAVRKTAEEKPRRLLETLVRDAALRALAFDKRIRAVRVRATKKPAAMPYCAGVTVELRRTSGARH